MHYENNEDMNICYSLSIGVGKICSAQRAGQITRLHWRAWQASGLGGGGIESLESGLNIAG